MNKINDFVVFVSVKFWKFFIILSVLLISVAIIKPAEDKDLYIVISVFTFIGLTTFTNTRPDETYVKLWPKKTQDEDEILDLRGKSIHFPVFIASLLLFILVM